MGQDGRIEGRRQKGKESECGGRGGHDQRAFQIGHHLLQVTMNTSSQVQVHPFKAPTNTSNESQS